jgi:hypothetical protein
MKPFVKKEDHVRHGEVRLVAEWITSLGDQQPGEFDPGRVEYARAFVDSVEEGVELCEEKDFFEEARIREYTYDKHCGWMFSRDIDPYD